MGGNKAERQGRGEKPLYALVNAPFQVTTFKSTKGDWVKMIGEGEALISAVACTLCWHISKQPYEAPEIVWHSRKLCESARPMDEPQETNVW